MGSERDRPGLEGDRAPRAGSPAPPHGPGPPPAGPQGIHHPVPQLSLSGGRGIFRAARGPAGRAVTIFAHGSGRCGAGVVGGSASPRQFPFLLQFGVRNVPFVPGGSPCHWPWVPMGQRGSSHLGSVPGPRVGTGSAFPRQCGPDLSGSPHRTVPGVWGGSQWHRCPTSLPTAGTAVPPANGGGTLPAPGM